MSGIKQSDPTSIISMIHGSEITPKPFEQEILLFETIIAGTSHIEGIHDLDLQIGDHLSFFRESDNEYDNQAIVIKTNHQEKIGYVPKSDNLVFSRLMDAGKHLFGKIKAKDLKGQWLVIKIEVYLLD